MSPYFSQVIDEIYALRTVFENRRKSLTSQHCERSELRLFSGQKFIKNAKNGQFSEDKLQMRHFE